MESYFNNFTDSVRAMGTSYSNSNQNINHSLCKYNNASTHVCGEKKCTKNPFICQNPSCQCKQEHQKCFTISIQSLLKRIQSNRVSTKYLQTLIINRFQQIIKQISLSYNPTVNMINKKYQYLGLSQNQKQFIRILNHGEQQYKITGSKIWEIINCQPSITQNTLKIVNQTCKNLQIQFNKSKSSINKAIQNINNQISKFQYNVNNCVQQKKTQINQNYKNPTLGQPLNYFSQSKIVKTQSQQSTLKDFFAPKSIKQVKLLYRASQHNFQVKKFHQKCDGISNTLILVKTQFGKKIGGYTPIKWNSSVGLNYVKDMSLQSFLFSLTNKDKFTLKIKQKAVLHHSGLGPIFPGGPDLSISDKSNINNSSSNINYTYQNDKYKFHDKDSWQSFHGNPNSQHFKTQQWEVLTVQFV